jgi:hypothetical protein
MDASPGKPGTPIDPLVPKGRHELNLATCRPLGTIDFSSSVTQHLRTGLQPAVPSVQPLTVQLSFDCLLRFIPNVNQKF